MRLQDIETTIFNCPYTGSIHCDARLRCHPIPGCGSADPEFLVLGINPGRRRGVWCKFDSLEELKRRYLVECMSPQFSYGKLLKRLEKLISQFRIPETVYLTDIVKCPTRKGLPPNKMIKQCVWAYLEKTVRVLDPQLIIGLGKLPSIRVGGFFSGAAAGSRRIRIAEHDYWFLAVPHPRGANIEALATAIANIVKDPKALVPVEFDKNFSTSPYVIKKRESGNMVEQKLANLGYRNVRGNRWIKENRVVHIVHSSEFGRDYIRIMWREKWKDDHTIIYDYSGERGPICVVPVSVLFMSNFVREKRKKVSYANSEYYWSQRFPVNHKLVELILNFKGQWDIL